MIPLNSVSEILTQVNVRRAAYRVLRQAGRTG